MYATYILRLQITFFLSIETVIRFGDTRAKKNVIIPADAYPFV